jgi:adenosylcobinamide-GDP ribazoletransferase
MNLKKHIKSIILTLQFFTRLPMEFAFSNLSVMFKEVDEADFTRGIAWFPLAGAVIGILTGLVFYIMKSVHFGPLVTGAVVASFVVLVTGGLHIDGLADFCDGVFSGQDKARMMEIMKDSRIGTFGTLSIVMLLILKTSSYFELYGVKSVAAAILMPVYSRLCAVILCYGASPAKEGGMGNLFIGKVRRKDLYIALICTFAFSLVNPLMLIILLVNAMFTLLFRTYAVSKLGGLTGDVIGASIELNEVVFLLFTVFFMKFIF